MNKPVYQLDYSAIAIERVGIFMFFMITYFLLLHDFNYITLTEYRRNKLFIYVNYLIKIYIVYRIVLTIVILLRKMINGFYVKQSL